MSFRNISESVNEIVEQISKIAKEAQQVDGRAGGSIGIYWSSGWCSPNSAAATEEMAASTEEQTASVQAIAYEAQKAFGASGKLETGSQSF